jgi:hypothetical protein
MTKGRDRVQYTAWSKAEEWIEVHELMPAKYSLGYLMSMGYLKEETIRYVSLTDDGLALIGRMNKRRKDAE